MNSFVINQTFDDWNSILVAKKNYEQASNTILSITRCNKLKGYGEFVSLMVYERLTFSCKAGPERPSSSKGIRTNSTYKMNCPFQVNIALVKDKLTVTSIESAHENHNTDRKTFLSYPENVRLTPEEEEDVRKFIECGANKQKIKANLMKKREAPLPLSVLHNLQSKVNLEKQTSNRKDDLKRLIEMMMTVPNAKVRVVVNVNNELIGIYYQDERMWQLFDKYPEIIFFDATHKLNNLDMPLFIQMCVDGNGESEIVNLYVCISESREGVGSMIDIFKELNPSWTRTKVILGDKDFADRSIYLEKFLNAVLKICIFHVQRTFRREITSFKRGITNGERDNALKVLQRLVYSTSEDEYNSNYSDLCNLNLDKVTEYYNENWHNIREEWTLFGINKDCNYLNCTNNRLESLNSKLKIVGNRNSNLQIFFENLSISVSNLSSEKDLKVLRGTMRRPRQCMSDPTLSLYKKFLTPFTFEKIEIQYELASKVEFVSNDNNEAIVKNKRNDKVSENGCSCLFYSSMDLPCRHIFKFLIMTDMDPFVPHLCANRWTNTYFNASHPALDSQIQINHPPPTFVKVRDPSEVDRSKKTATIVKEIKSLSTNFSNSEYSYFLDKLKDIKNEMVHERVMVSKEDPLKLSTNLQDCPTDRVVEMPLDLSVNMKEQKEPNKDDTTENSKLPIVVRDNVIIIENVDVTPLQNNLIQTLKPQTVNMDTSSHDPSNELSVFRQSQNVSILSSIENINIPVRKNAVGRPKGSEKTVIGTKRKKFRYGSKSSKKISEDQDLSGFANKTQDEQTLTIIEWLTQSKSSNPKTLSKEDIVCDKNIFQRLRNDEIFLSALKKVTNTDVSEYIKNEVYKMNNEPWICSKCKLVLDGEQVRCEYCLDWFHLECVREKSKRFFICPSC